MSMLQAVMDGNGTMAQFDHPEFGGAGQWMQGGMTMVLVTHEMEFAARVADIVIYMHEGKVWETGPGDMLKNPQTAELRDFLSHGL